jgi:magnesium chelatase family protein
MLFKARSAAVYGIDANIIEVEVDFSGVALREDVFNTVGLPDAAVRESRDRVRSAPLSRTPASTSLPPASPSTSPPPT